MGQGGQAVLAEGQPLHLAKGRVLFNGLHVLAPAGAVMQLWRVAVGGAGQLIQAAARERAQAIQVRLEMLKQVRREV